MHSLSAEPLPAIMTNLPGFVSPGLRKLRVVHSSEGERWRATKVEKSFTLVAVLFQTMER